MLTPIDEAYALRPSLAHMSSTRNDADAKAKAAAEDEEDEKPSEPQHIRVRCLLVCSCLSASQVLCSSKTEFCATSHTACNTRDAVTACLQYHYCEIHLGRGKHCMRACRCMCSGGRRSGSRSPA